MDPAGAHPRPSGSGPNAASALPPADRVAAADPLGALPPRGPAAAQPADVGQPRVARRSHPAGRRPRADHDLAERDRRARYRTGPLRPGPPRAGPYTAG